MCLKFILNGGFKGGRQNKTALKPPIFSWGGGRRSRAHLVKKNNKPKEIYFWICKMRYLLIFYVAFYVNRLKIVSHVFKSCTILDFVLRALMDTLMHAAVILISSSRNFINQTTEDKWKKKNYF